MSHNIPKTTLAALVVAAALAGLPPSPAAAYTTGTPPATTTTTVAAGEGHQTDPHISGSLVSYTSWVGSTSEIRYHDLATGVDAAIPTAGHRDGLSDVSGTTIVFSRVYTDGTNSRDIMAFDTATGGPPVVLDPGRDVWKRYPAIGGRTVAWMEFASSSLSQSEVVVYDLDTGVATPLTADGNLSNQSPAVSADGSVVTWAKCSDYYYDCDVYGAVRAGGTWGAATRLTDSTGNELLDDTNGEMVVYSSDAGGDWDIGWEALDGTQEGSLSLPGDQFGARVSGDLVVFESQPAGSHDEDLWLYHLGTDTLYQLTDTPEVDKFPSDVSLAPDGTVRVVWAQYDGTAYYLDVFAMSFRLDANRPPDCGGVDPSTASLWPPNHQMSAVSLAGASDPDGDPVTLTVTAVTQDEAVDGDDDGATATDAQLTSAPERVLLRAERSGSGDGRVYRLAFTAADPARATCTGVAVVDVPLDRDGAAVDSGGTYDSLAT